jgi:hypothetical protein
LIDHRPVFQRRRSRAAFEGGRIVAQTDNLILIPGSPPADAGAGPSVGRLAPDPDRAVAVFADKRIDQDE